MRFNFVLFFFVSWLLAQLFLPIKFLSFSFLESFSYLKALIPAIGVVGCVFLYVDKVKFIKRGIPFYLFCALCITKSVLLILIEQKYLGYYFTSIMYVLWVIVLFVVSPSVFDSQEKIERFLRYVVITFSFFAILCSSLIVFLGIDFSLLYRDGRFTFVYSNPLYLGGIAYSMFCCCFMLNGFSHSKAEKILLFSLSVICFWAIFESFSRTFMLGILYLLIVELNYKFKLHSSSRLLIASVIMITFLSFYLTELVNNTGLGAEDINQLSSNRIENWSIVLDESGRWWSVIFGGDGTAQYDATLISAESDVVRASFERFSIDNAYIELFVNNGLIGLGLILWGLFGISRMANFSSLIQSEKGKDVLGITSRAKSVFGSLVITAFFYGHFPSLGNAINAVVFPAALSVIFLADGHAVTTRIIKRFKHD